MNKQKLQTQNLKTTAQQSKTEDMSINPRKAATKAKELNNQVEIMRRRLKVLQGQQDYNRYKTVDQEKRIHQHLELHQKIAKDRQVLRKSLEKVGDLSEVKQKTEQLRLQIRQKIKEARKNLIEDRTERTTLISDESAQHENQIKQHREREMSENKDRKVSIQFQQEKKRQSVSRQFIDKLKTIKYNKSIDSGTLTRRAEKSEQELSRLMIYEQELLKKNSQSLQASQVMRHKFNQVFTTIGSNSSRMLPQIRVRTNNSKHTNSTEMPMI